jgi:hypothetical protein
VTQTNITVRVMSANLSSGNNQRYETPGLNIFKGLNPDIVAIQEFNYASTNDLYIASVHLKASSGSSNESRRASSMDSSRAGSFGRHPTARLHFADGTDT